MKHFHFLLLILAGTFMNMMADDSQAVVINMHGTSQGNHFELPTPADEPDVYLDSGNAVVIIDGTGYVSSYDVVIESVASWTTGISTSVDGNYDTIDISALPQGEYCITISSPSGNSYEGFFDTY